MKIFVHNDSKIQDFSEYFDYNQIDYEKKDFWTFDVDKNGQYLLPYQDKNQLIVVDVITFRDIISCDLSYQYLIDYLNNKNILWVGQKRDATLRINEQLDQLWEIDSLVPKNSLVLWMDGLPTDHWSFKNIAQEFNLYTFCEVARIKNTVFTKKTNSYDFFVTCRLHKREREHRNILNNALKQRSLLLKNSLQVFKEFQADYINYGYTDYVGDQPHQFKWFCEWPSMDIYSQSLIEIVPETKFRDFHFLTEKTVKSIVTKTPFLVVSTPGYLDFLKSLGFKTFNSLIDESYDRENNIHSRVEKMLDTLEDIVINGTKNFYESSKPILDHNYNKLCEISCKKRSIVDHLIYNQLSNARNLLD